MKYKTDAYTDIGIKKEVNQDALIVKQARTSNNGRVCMACLCDGMGGLSQGEVASATFINRMEQWFTRELPAILSPESVTVQLDSSDIEIDYFKQIEIQWNQIAQQMNHKLKKYGQEKGIQLGTTAVAIFMMNGRYIVMSVGDSRAYMVNKKELRQITHDHSFVQRQIDLGQMTKEEALSSNKKSVLLQCIGASDRVVPDFYYGYADNNTFLLCSDGLWRKLKEDEMISFLAKKEGIKQLAEIVKKRGETDNISGLIVSA